MFIGITYNKNVNKHNFVANLIKICIFLLFLCVIFAFFINMNNKSTVFAFAEQENGSIEKEIEESTDNLLSDLDFSGLEEMVVSLDENFNIFNGLGFKEYLKAIVKGEQNIQINDLFALLLNSIKQSFVSLLFPLLCVFVVVLLCNVFNNLKSNKLSGVSEVIYFVCFSVIVIIISSLSANVIEKTKDSIQNIQKQMNIIFPILLSLVTTMGGVISVKAYTPMIAFLSNVISNVFVYVLLPLFTLSLILSIVGNLSQNIKLGKFNAFIHSSFKWIVGVVFTIFISFLSLNGITAGASDGISIKATKFAIKNYVPLLGGYISDGFELVKAGSLLIKNATGFASIVLLFSVVCVPVISIGALQLGLKFLAGIVEPVGDSRSANLINSIANSLRLLLAILIGVALMYFLTIFLIICSASNFV